MTKILTGLFPTAADASGAVHALTSIGIAQEDISIVASDRIDASAFGVDSHTKLPEGAAIGASAGGAVGAIIAGFTLIGTLATGGAGLLVAGPLVAALAGAGAGAATGAGVGALIGLAIPEHEVKHYENALEHGAVLVGVQMDPGDERLDEVRSLLNAHHAERVSHA
jgi:hypothetical protein